MSTDTSDAPGAPGVGNVLGLSLLLRRRRALLALEGRTVRPGVRIVGYEADIPEVEFPLRPPLSPTRFRHHRCVARRVLVTVELHALRDWLRDGLEGATFGELSIERIEVDLQGHLSPSGGPLPCVLVHGRVASSPALLLLAVQLRAVGRRVGVTPVTAWGLGFGLGDPLRHWRAIAARLGAVARDELTVDPVRATVMHAFVRAGWKAPDLGALVLESSELQAASVALRFGLAGEVTAAPPAPPAPHDPIALSVARVHEALAAGDRAGAIAQLVALTDELVHHDQARVAALRWLADMAGAQDPTTSANAMRTWLHLAPRDVRAGRMLLARLWQAGRPRELAQRLATACRLDNPDERQARLELALACMLVDHLGDAEGGRALLQPLIRRTAGDPAALPLHIDALAALARAAATDPPATHAALALALSQADRPARSASIRAGVGRALAAAGHASDGLEVLRLALTEAPDDRPTFELAIDLAEHTADLDALAELLDHAAAHPAQRDELGSLRRRVLTWLAGRETAREDQLTVRVLDAALRDEPDAPDLLARLAELQNRRGDAEGAASVLERLSDQATDPGERAALVLQRARLLEDSGDPGAAWASLSTVLDIHDPQLEPEILVTALTLAPAAAKEEIVDRLVAIDAGDRGGQALLARAAVATSEHQRHRDLSRAAELLDDPRPALRQLARLAPDDQRHAWARLAEACADHGDAAGEIDARIELALRCLAARELSQARDALVAALRLRPDREAAVLLGLVLARSGDDAAAAELLLPWAAEHLPALDRGLLADPRAGVDPTPGLLTDEIAGVFERAEEPQAALAIARRVLPSVADPELARTIKIRIARLAEDLDDPGAAEALAAVAEATSGEEAATWFLRAAQRAPGQPARRWLAAARHVAPRSVAVLEAWEEEARAEGDLASLERALSERAEVVPAPHRAHVLRELLGVRLRQSGGRASSTLDTASKLLRVDPTDPDASALLAADFDRRGEPASAEKHWANAFDSLGEDDPRLPDVAVRLARRSRVLGDLDEALRLLERPRRISPTTAVFDELREIATAKGDAGLRLEAAHGRRALANDDPERARSEVELAQLYEAGGDPSGALERLTNAAAWAHGNPQLRAAIAQRRLQLCLDADLGAEAELAARAEVRAAGAAESTEVALREELALMARLGRHVEAIGVIHAGLASRPADPLLLSELKAHALAADQPGVYVAAVERALDGNLDPDLRDRLALELAMAAADLGDATQAMHALEHNARAFAESPEALDVWDWAVVALGLEAEELRRIDDRLLAAPADASWLRRLQRRLDDPQFYVEHLLALAGRREGTARDLLAAAIAEALTIPDNTLLLRTVRICLGHGASDLVREHWADIEDRTVRSGDDGAIADLVQLADDGGDAALRERANELLDVALAWIPQAASLHRALWARLRGDADDVASGRSALTHVERIANDHELSPDDRARLVVGVARQLPRRAAAQLLVERAQTRLRDAEAFHIFVSALEEDGHWPEAVMLHEARVGAVDDPEKVAIHKHLAHIATDTLADPNAAVHHLETALKLAPTDPDLLLPLLDHHFARKDLARAVQLSRLVLQTISMGPAAYVALAHRAADAAVANDEPHLAIEILQMSAERVPTESRAAARIEELERIADDPARRVVMLASVADRQSGNARWQALEERARLLLDPLDRLGDAIEALEAVVAEAPARSETTALLRELYRRAARWPALVDLLESTLPRRHGLDRARTLREIAQVHREALGDVVHAEQAVRAAMEHVQPEEDPSLWDGLCQELADDLSAQQRWPDFVAHAERWLGPDLAPESESPPSPVRIAYLERLASTHRDALDDQAAAARVYERLLDLGSIPDDGLASLARWYHHERRHRELVGVLSMRAAALTSEAQAERRAAVELRIAELLEGPLGRPHEAAPHYLEAYLADPETQVAAGARARVLLSGTDSVANVRQRLRDRAAGLPSSRRPALLTLLGDLLAPQDGYEEEAEAYYRKALEIDEGAAAASEGLGRLLVRRGRPEEGARALLDAARSETVPPSRAAECAAAAARQFLDLGQPDVAERAIKLGLRRHPTSRRAMLELARVYESTDRPAEQQRVLEELAAQPLSIALQAEVAFRRAMLLRDQFETTPRGPAGERARAQLLEAVGADATHTAARQALLELATARQEWAIVAHMQFLTVRELPLGPARARANLDLAATYLDRLDDGDSALRHVVSALQQATDDTAVTGRVAQLMARMPDRVAAAEQLEAFASEMAELGEAARARLWLLAADLRMPDDDEPVNLETVHQGVPDELDGADADADSRSHQVQTDLAAIMTAPAADQVAALLTADRRASERADLELAEATTTAIGRVAAACGADMVTALRVALLSDHDRGRGSHGLLARLAASVADRDVAAEMWVLAAELAWRIDGRHREAAAYLAEAAGSAASPAVSDAIDALVVASIEHDEAAEVWSALADVAPATSAGRLHRARLGLALGRLDEALTLARPLTAVGHDTDLRFAALGIVDAVLARRGEAHERLDGLAARLDLALARQEPSLGEIATDLAQLQLSLDQPAAALRTCTEAAQFVSSHRGLLRLRAQLLDQLEAYDALVGVYDQLTALSRDADEQAMWLTRSADVLVRHPELSPGTASERAADLLRRACELAPRRAAPRIALIPLALTAGRWSELEQTASELLALGEGHDVLVLAALGQAYQQGRRDLATRLGVLTDPSAVSGWLIRGIDHVLEQVARHGPLPRLDDVLGAAATLAGGRGPLLEALVSHDASRLARAGITLALARLHESRGAATAARHHYQLATFLAPQGPVPALVARLPPAPLAERVDQAGAGPMEGRSPLRLALMQLAPRMAGLEARPGPERTSPSRAMSVVVERAEAIVAPWRERLRVPLLVGWLDAPDLFGVGIRNSATPAIVLTPASLELRDAELAFRLAEAAATLVTGMGVLESGTYDATDLLEAVRHVANPMLRPSRPGGQHLADALSERDASLRDLTVEDRADLVQECSHWLSTADGPARWKQELLRSRRLFGARLSGRLDGALHAIAREHMADGAAALRPRQLLSRPDVQWLCRSLGLR
jgi:Tfp pilus assembly protein PilF